MACNHNSCGDKEKVWLPHKYHGLDCGLRPHLYCTQCGLVKITSLDRPRRLGYYINIVAGLAKEFRITKVQIRLIAKELQKLGIDDAYGMDKRIQERIFVETMQKYSSLPEQAISKFLNRN